MSSQLYEAYEQDESAAEQGQWVTELLVPIKMHGQTSKRVRDVHRDLDKRYKQAMLAGGGELPPDKLERKMVQLLALGIVSNWGKKAALADGVPVNLLPEGEAEIQDRDGVELPYTVEHATKIFTELPIFRLAVLNLFNSTETFRKAAVAALSGNSAAPSLSDSASGATSRVS